MMGALFFVVALLLTTRNGHRQPFAQALHASTADNNSPLQIDLGYEIYQGYSNASTGLNVWKGYVFEGEARSFVGIELNFCPF